MRPKHQEISELLRRRISNGHYLTASFPGERTLAKELGVSHMTGRRVIRDLVDVDVLRRLDNGRITINERAATLRNKLQVGFVTPAYPSESLNKWWLSLRAEVERRHGIARMIPYLDWDDPTVWAAVNGDMDRIFIIPPSDLPRLLLERLVAARHKVVSMFVNLTDHGVCGIDGGAIGNLDKLFDHLAAQGHRRVDCFNSQPQNRKITEHIAYWQQALAARGLEGELHNDPVPSFGHPAAHARLRMNALLRRGAFHATAVYCVTVAAAKGVMRGLADHGLRIGRDVAVCSFGGGDEARMMVPSLTTVDTPDPAPVIGQAIDRLQTQRRDSPAWFLRPENVGLFVGETTRPDEAGAEPLP